MKYLNSIKNKLKKRIKNITKEDIIIFSIPFFMFLIYWIIFYPGILSYDSHYQINEIMSSSFDTAHPFFHTFIEMVLMKIWNTPAAVGLFQILVFSTLWTKICKYNRKENNKTMFFAQILLTCIIVLNPLNKTMSITLWKDVLYSYTVLWFCFEIEKLVDKKFILDFPNLLKLSFLLLLLPNLRHNGYIITLLMGTILIILFFVYDKKSRNYLKFFLLSVMFFFCFKGLERVYHVEEKLTAGDAAEVMDYKLLSLTGEIGRKGKITNEEVKEVNKYASFNKLVLYTHYNVIDVIWILCEVDGNVLNAHQDDFYKLMTGLISKNKLLTIKYYMKEASFVWKIVRYNDSFGIINYYGIGSNNATVSYIRPFGGTKLLQTTIKYIIFTTENKLFQTVYYSGSLYLYLSIIALLFLKYKYKINRFLVITPIFINLLGLILTMPVNDVRYYYSNFLVSYLIGAIFIRYQVGMKDEKKKR